MDNLRKMGVGWGGFTSIRSCLLCYHRIFRLMRLVLRVLRFSLLLVLALALRRYLHEYHEEPSQLPWAAPEYLRQDLMGYCDKIDVYSVGIVALELLLGNQPYAGLLPTEILLLKLQDENGPLALVHSFLHATRSFLGM